MYKTFKKIFSFFIITMMVSLFITGCSDNDDDDNDAPAVTISSIQITPPNATVPAGTTGEYIAMAYYSDDTSLDVTQDVTWLSDDNTTLSITSGVENAGYASALSQGVANITATLSNVTSNSAKVTVTDATLESIQVSPATRSVAAGIDVHYIATGIYSDGTQHSLTKSVSWQSSEETVAKIAENGLATTLVSGSTNITASIASITPVTSNSATLTVTSATITSVLIAKAKASITEIGIPSGVDVNYIATAYLSDGSDEDVTKQVT